MTAARNRTGDGSLDVLPLVAIALGLTVGVAGLGALGAFAVAMTTVLSARKQGSFRDLGLRFPDS